MNHNFIGPNNLFLFALKLDLLDKVCMCIIALFEWAKYIV